MHFFAAFYSFLFILLHFSMISDRFRVKVRVEGGEGAKEAMPVSGAEERTHIIIFARRRAKINNSLPTRGTIGIAVNNEQLTFLA